MNTIIIISAVANIFLLGLFSYKSFLILYEFGEKSYKSKTIIEFIKNSDIWDKFALFVLLVSILTLNVITMMTMLSLLINSFLNYNVKELDN